GGDDAAHERAHDQQQHQQPEQRHHDELGRLHDVVLAELQVALPAGRLVVERRGRGFGKAQIDHFELVAALGVETDRGAHQRGDAVDLFLGARLVDDLALGVLRVNAVDKHCGGNAPHAARFGDLGLAGVRNLVVDDLFALAVRVARGVRIVAVAVAAARQFVADRDLAAGAVGIGGLLFARLARAHDAAVGIVFVGGLRDAVEIEIGGHLHARVAGTDDRVDDGLYLAAQTVFVTALALVDTFAGEGV